MNAGIFLATTGNGLARAERHGEGGWQVTSLLEGEGVRCLAGDPLDPEVVYAGTHGSGVLRSCDRGWRWQPAGLHGRIVTSLAVSPHRSDVVYAGTKPPCVFVSHDGGRQWDELEGFRRIRGRWLWRSPADPPDWRAYVQAVSLSPTDPSVIVAGIECGAVVRSSDGGRTWSNHIKGTLRDCHSLTFHVQNGDWVYEAGGSGGGAAVSRDGGHTWTQLKQGRSRHYGWACAADSERPEVWYLSASPLPSLLRGQFVPPAHVDGHANAAIYRSSGGATWEKLRGGLPQPLDYMAYALLTDQTAPGHLYAGLSNGDVWHSADYGDHWHKLPFRLPCIRRTLIAL